MRGVLLIQLLLLGALLAFLVVFVRNRHGVKMQAGKRVGLVLFAALTVYAVVRPDDVTTVAQLLGVGRGADLLLYALAVAFVLAILNLYLRFRWIDRQLTDLARTLAIREAEIVNRERALLPPHDAVATTVTPERQPGPNP
ncbi:MAG TPA: DUF2304 domain-containing protein [Pseudonocardia sp.]|nr:DUF2304 domain-containing protein [Pseudonocardia sp.]